MTGPGVASKGFRESGFRVYRRQLEDLIAQLEGLLVINLVTGGLLGEAREEILQGSIDGWRGGGGDGRFAPSPRHTPA